MVNFREVNFRDVLVYEFFLVLLLLVYCDGSLRKIIKSVFMFVLEEKVCVLVRLLVEL